MLIQSLNEHRQTLFGTATLNWSVKITQSIKIYDCSKFDPPRLHCALELQFSQLLQLTFLKHEFPTELVMAISLLVTLRLVSIALQYQTGNQCRQASLPLLLLDFLLARGVRCISFSLQDGSHVANRPIPRRLLLYSYIGMYLNYLIFRLGDCLGVSILKIYQAYLRDLSQLSAIRSSDKHEQAVQNNSM